MLRPTLPSANRAVQTFLHSPPRRAQPITRGPGGYLSGLLEKTKEGWLKLKE